MKKGYQKEVVSVFLALLFVAFSYHDAQAVVPVTDTQSTAKTVQQWFTEVKESKTVVGTMQTIQKTNAAIGAAKKSVSEYVLDNKKKLEEKLDKLQKYKDKAEEYKKQYDEYKKQLDDNIAKAKDLKDKAEQGIETAKNAIDTAKTTIDTAKDTVNAAVDVAKDKVSGVQDKVENAVDTAKDKVGISEDTPTTDTQTTGTPSEPVKNIQSPTGGLGTPGASLAVEPEIVTNQAQLPEANVATEAPVSSRKTFGSGALTTNDALPEQAKVTNNQSVNKVTGTHSDAATALPMQENNIVPVQAPKAEGNATQNSVSANVTGTEMSASTVSNQKAISATPQSNTPTERIQLRKAFTTSSLHQSEKLMFAKVEMLNLPDGGTDSNGTVIIPEALALYCGLSSSDALEEGAVDECLLRLNKERKAAQIFSGSDAPKIYNLAMAQYAAAAMAEAYKARQDADSFEENFIDAVDFASEPDAQAVYDNIVEMNKALDMQMNGLLRVFSTQLAVQSLHNYGAYSFVPEEEEEAEETKDE